MKTSPINTNFHPRRPLVLLFFAHKKKVKTTYTLPSYQTFTLSKLNFYLSDKIFYQNFLYRKYNAKKLLSLFSLFFGRYASLEGKRVVEKNTEERNRFLGYFFVCIVLKDTDLNFFLHRRAVLISVIES